MKFSRSLRGYQPSFVRTEIEKTVFQYQQEEDEQKTMISSALAEGETLKSKLESAKGRLKADHNFLHLTEKYENYLRNDLIQKARAAAEEKIDRMQKDAAEFEAEVDRRSRLLEEKITWLKGEINSVVTVIEEILKTSGVDPRDMESQMQNLNSMIDEFQQFADRPPTAALGEDDLS